MLSETVNPASGSVSLRIQVPTPKGRGISIPFSFSYDSNSVHHLQSAYGLTGYGKASWISNIGYLSQGGWHYGVPLVSASYWPETQGLYPNFYTCLTFTNYLFSDSFGVQHALGLGFQGNAGNLCGRTPVTSGADQQVKAWLPPYNGYPTAFGFSPVTVATADGTVYTFNEFGNNLIGSNQTYYALVQSIEDRNGNIINATDNGNGNFVFTDTAGRTVISANGFGPSGTTNTLTFSGLTYQLTWKTENASFSTTTPIWVGPAGEPDVYDECTPISGASDSQTVISRITLPNGEAYNFYYGTDAAPHATQTNPYGLLSEIDYPTGGWVTYTWKLSDNPNELADYAGVHYTGPLNCGTDPMGPDCPNPVPDGCQYLYSTPVVASRSVGFGSNPNPSLTQTFVYNTTWASNQWTEKDTSVTSADAVTGKSWFTKYSYSPIPAPGAPYIYYGGLELIPVEHVTSVYDWGNRTTPLQTHTKNWYDQFNLANDTTTVYLANGSTLMSEEIYCYAGTNCTPNAFSQLKTTSEYDYGQGAVGALLRQTTQTYQTFSNTPGYTANAPCKTVVFDGNNNPYEETDYLYDGNSTLCGAVSSASSTSGVTVVAGTHDESNFGPSTTTPRGNVTTKTKWLSTGNSPVTTYAYDETGRVVSMTDPCGNGTCSDMPNATTHTTNYYYADSYTTGTNTCSAANGPAGNTNALLTKIVYPLTSGVVHSECFSYDYNSGQLTGMKDENGQLTTYAYNDPFYRPTQANYPDTGSTTISYNDTAPSPSVTTSKLITSTVTLGATTVMDGMGHVVQNQVTTDPEGTDYVDTSYDGMGQTLSVSNPHRSSAASTDGTTVNTFDGLGRTTRIQRQDGSSVQTVYGMTCSASPNGLGKTVTDEAGKQRTSCFDGLGRLVEVDEPGVGASDGSPGTGTITVGGGTQSTTINPCQGNTAPAPTSCPQTVYNGGTMYAIIGGFIASTGYGGPGDTASAAASRLATALNGSGSPVTAVASGTTVTVTSQTAGADTNFSINTPITWNTTYFSAPSYSITSSGMSGGTNPSLGANPPVTLYGYDPLNNLKTVQQQGGTSNTAQWRNRSFSYDSLSRLLSASNPESGTISYQYDANSNVVTRTAPLANLPGTTQQTTTTYTYDALNRVVQVAHANPSNANASYSYDGTAISGCTGIAVPTLSSPTNLIGRRSAMCTQQSTSSFSYDPMGRLSAEARSVGLSAPVTYTTGYTYYKDGSLNTLTYPSGDVVTYTVGGAGRVTQVSDSNNTFVAAPSAPPMYAPAGQLLAMTQGSGITTNNIYNDRLQPILLSAGPASGSPVLSLCYDFHSGVALNVTAPNNQKCNFSAYTTGNNGNVFQVLNNVDSTRSAAFLYDSLNRITQANTVNTTSGNCWGEAYTIDAWGNLTNIAAAPGMGAKCSTESLNAAPASAGNQLNGYCYDAAGNLLLDSPCPSGSFTPTYYYDAENQLYNPAATYTYWYDADGVRARKAASAPVGTMYWPGPGGEFLMETNGSGTISEEYIYFDGERIARVDRPSGTVHYYFSDKLGSASAITDPTGTIVQETYYYYPYGGMVASIGSDTNHYLFTGKERDTETGNDYFGARYYGSNLGRFLTPDWAAKPTSVPYAVFGDPQSLNLYAYVENGPINRADADGHFLSTMGVCPQQSGAASACDPFAKQTEQNKPGQPPPPEAPRNPPAQNKPQYDPKKSGPEDPTNPGHPLSQNPVVKKASDEAFMKTTNGQARSGLAEAGFAIDYKDGKISIVNKVDSVNSDKKANELQITTDENTKAILHTHGNSALPTPSPGDLKSPVPNFVRSQRDLYVTVPGTDTYIQLQ
jgi:RHS repeat-associated protein